MENITLKVQCNTHISYRII